MVFRSIHKHLADLALVGAFLVAAVVLVVIL